MIFLERAGTIRLMVLGRSDSCNITIAQTQPLCIVQGIRTATKIKRAITQIIDGTSSYTNDALAKNGTTVQPMLSVGKQYIPKIVNNLDTIDSEYFIAKIIFMTNDTSRAHA